MKIKRTLKACPNCEQEQKWHKLCALLMFKQGIKQVTLSIDDLRAFEKQAPLNVLHREMGPELTLYLLNDRETMELALGT